MKDTENNFDKSSLIDNWQQVTRQVTQAGEQAKDSAPDEVILLAVSKTKPAEMIATLAEQGQRPLGKIICKKLSKKSVP